MGKIPCKNPPVFRCYAISTNKGNFRCHFSVVWYRNIATLFPCPFLALPLFLLVIPCPSLVIPCPSLSFPLSLPYAFPMPCLSMYNLCHPLPYPCPYLAPTKPIKIFYLCISHYIEVNPHQRHHKSVAIPYISTITRFFLLNYKKPQNKC